MKRQNVTVAKAVLRRVRMAKDEVRKSSQGLNHYHCSQDKESGFYSNIDGRQFNNLNRTEIGAKLSFKRITLDAVLRMDNEGRGMNGRKQKKQQFLMTDVGGLNERGRQKEINGSKIFNEHNNNSQWINRW